MSTSNGSPFLTNILKSMMNQDMEFDSIAVVGILKSMNDSYSENRTIKVNGDTFYCREIFSNSQNL